MTDRDGLKEFWVWLKVYDTTSKPDSHWDLMDLREAWLQGVAWGRQNPIEEEGIGLGEK